MFDLFRSREKSVRYLLTGLLVLVALSMVTYLIPGSGMGGGYAEDTVIAEIGKDTLTMRDVQTNLQAAMKNRSLPPELAAQLIPQYVNQMISERALAFEAERLGFDVSDDDLAQAIRSIFPQLFPNGQFAGRDVYQAMLAQQNLSVAQFERDLRKQLLLTKIRNLALEGVVVTPDEVEKEFRRRNQKIKLDYVALTADKYRSQATVTPQEIKDDYEKNKPGFQVPMKRSYDLLIADEDQITKAIAIPETELRRAYEQNRDRFRTPERVHVRHILLKTADKPKDEIPKIKEKAEALLKQVKGGADFADLAKKNSEDPGSAAKGGDLDWISRGQTVKNFEESAFSLKPGETSNLITTEYGFHIIQVLEKQEARVKPFEEVKDELANERKKQMVYDRMQTSADQARQLLSQNPTQADAIAKKLGLEVVHVEKAGLADAAPQLGANADLQNALNSMKKGEVTPVIQAGNKLAVATITEIFPPRQAELNEVEEQIRTRLVDQKASRLLEQKSNELAEKLKAPKAELKQVAKAMGLEVKSTGEFDINGAAEGIGPGTVFTDAFSKNAGEVVGPMRVADKTIFGRIVSKTEADMSKFAQERAALQEQLKSKLANERKELFEDSVVTALVKAGKVKIHEDAVKRLVQAYAQS